MVVKSGLVVRCARSIWKTVVADCVDGLLHWRHDYFRDPADPDRLWRLGQVVSALARAGLQVEALEEYPGGTSRRRHDRRIPATFLLYARRAA